MSAVWNTQDEDYPVPSAEQWVHKTKFQDAGPVPESGVPGDEAGVGRARATHPDELPGYASGQHGGDPQHDDAWPVHMTPGSGHVRMPLGPDEEEKTVSEYVAARQEGLPAAYWQAHKGLQRVALHQKHDYDSKVQRREYQAGELVWIHNITLARNPGTKLQFPWYGQVLITKVLDRGRIVVYRKQDKPLTVVHVDRLEAYRGTAMPAWMTAEQRGCVAV